jgi:hypothetical protein
MVQERQSIGRGGEQQEQHISSLEDHTNENSNSNVVAVDPHDGTTPNIIVAPTPLLLTTGEICSL